MAQVLIALLIALVLCARVSIAEPLSCHSLHSARSSDSAQIAELRITNESDAPAALVWIDFAGRGVPYSAVAPRAVVRQPSYVGHVWALQSLQGNCLCAMRLRQTTRWTMRGKGACGERIVGTFEPTSEYKVENVEGWRVLVSSRFAGFRAERQSAIAALRSDLAVIRGRLLPQTAATLLQDTKIWLERSDDLFPDRGVYHLSRDFLVASEMNPDKAKSIQFTVRSLEQRKGQPAMVLHELAHAFHDQVFGYDDQAIASAFLRACSDVRLRSVERTPGYPERHYGLSNQTEFFAEFSEAHFWENDYPPKNREQLLAFDPSIDALIETSWSTVRRNPDRSSDRIRSCAES